MLLFNNVFFSELELEGHLTGVGLDCNVSPEEGLAVEYPGHSERAEKVFFLVAIDELVFVDDSLGEGRHYA